MLNYKNDDYHQRGVYMLKNLIFIVLIFVLSACSPKYKIIKEYHAPKNAQACLNSCQFDLDQCKKNCQIKFNTCKKKADEVAQSRYRKKLDLYHRELESYANAVQRYNFDMQFEYALYNDPFYYGRSPFYHRGFFYDPFWYSPRYYMPPRPRKPSLEREKLKAEEQMCDLDCDCGKKYDLCFSGCGGEILNKKVCVENCPSE